jgi:hypothetical protein
MTDTLRQLESMLVPGATAVPRFPASSRYHSTPVARLELPDGRVVAYLRRRFVPPPEAFSTLREHTIVQSDRLDRLAAESYGDPELFWRLCDANGALRPNELTDVVGRGLRITLPEGVPGSTDG